jgi:sugar fermentation stimulation protein A
VQFPELLTGRLIRRYKRFFADIELDSGTTITAHCANPGRMTTCAPDRARVWVSRSDNPARKLAYTWELVESNGAIVCVNTARGNAIVGEALDERAISEVADYPRIQREVRYGERSRVDFMLSDGDDAQCYLEVKSVTLDCGGGISSFPDSVTERGRRHLEELMAMVDQGHRAVMLFCAQRSDARRVRPADDVDPDYGRTLRRARAHGVEILAYRCEVSPDGMAVRERIPVDYPGFPV